MYLNGITSNAPKGETAQIVPYSTCYDTCKIVWEPETYKLDDECILEYSVKQLSRVMTQHNPDPKSSTYAAVQKLNLPLMTIKKYTPKREKKF